MPLTPADIDRLATIASERGLDPVALIRIAVEEEGTAANRGTAERLLIGFLHWVKVNELRECLGLPQVSDGDEYCTEFAIKRRMIPEPKDASTANPFPNTAAQNVEE